MKLQWALQPISKHFVVDALKQLTAKTKTKKEEEEEEAAAKPENTLMNLELN
jgi:hypothetical protein